MGNAEAESGMPEEQVTQILVRVFKEQLKHNKAIEKDINYFKMDYHNNFNF